MAARIGNAPQPSQLARLRAELKNPLGWDEIARSFIVQIVQAPAMLGFALRGGYLLQHPEIEPYFDRAALKVLTGFLLGLELVSLALVVVGLWLRRSGRSPQGYLHVLSFTWWFAFGFIAYLHGPSTTPFWIFFPFLGLGCLVLFDTPMVLTGVATALAVLYGTTIAERLGYIPYAPLFARWPGTAGRLADEWAWSTMIWPPATSLVIMLLFRSILRQAREQAAQLAALAHASGAHEERARITRDLHDDVASRLLTLTQRARTPEDGEHARQALGALRDVVRGLDDNRTTRLVDAIADWRAEIRDRCEGAGLGFEWHQEAIPEAVYLGARERLNLTRALSEAASNAFRHAGARRLLVSARHDGTHCWLIISDDGTAGDVAVWQPGRGLHSIVERANEIGGRARYFSNHEAADTRLQTGASVEICFPAVVP